MKSKFIKTLFLCLLSVHFLSAQSGNPLTNVQISSPNAAALGKYGDIPISYHTGVPSITIPIHTVQDGQISLPISLNYHASGIKVMDIASWVGMGWNLQAGGTITRTVRGSPDEKVGRINQQTGHYRHYGYNSLPEGILTGGYVNNLGNSVNCVANGNGWQQIENGLVDAEPDMFSFSFNGYSGKFYFREDRSVMLIPEQDLKVEVVLDTLSGLDGGFRQFCITIPDGSRYYFGENNARDKSNPYMYQGFQGDNYVYSSWYLTRIVSADSQREIKLIYASEKYSYNTVSFGLAISSIRTIITGIRLDTIKTTNETIRFIPGSLREDLDGFTSSPNYPHTTNTEARTLATIEIKNKTGQGKKFDFAYTYFYDGTSPIIPNVGFGNYPTGSTASDQKRLKLESVQEKALDNSISKPAHIFTYYITAKVPRRLTYAQDHWGYYNGKTSNPSMLPSLITTCTNYIGAERDAKWPEMQEGTIKKIQYPTGGSTEFIFEAHDVPVSFTETTKSGSALVDLFDFPDNVCTGSTCCYQQTVNFPYTGTYMVEINGGPYGGGGTGGSAGANQTTLTCVNFNAGSQLVYISSNNGVPGGTCAPATLKIYTTQTTLVNENRAVGGLRIKEIRNNDGISSANDFIKTYEYKFSDQKSTGVLYGRPTYKTIIRNDNFAKYGTPQRVITGAQGAGVNHPSEDPFSFGYDSYNVDGCTGYGFGVGYQTTSMIRSIFEMRSTQGNHIGYSQVKEIIGRANGTNLGYKMYRYQISQSNIYTPDQIIKNYTTCSADIPNFPQAPEPHDFTRGDLLEEWHYDSNGNLEEWIKYENSYYNNPNTIPGFIVATNLIESNRRDGTQYYLNTAKLISQKITKRIYDDNGKEQVSVQESFYSSTKHNQLTVQQNTDSKGKLNVQKTTYIPDIALTTCNPTYTCDSDYQIAISQYEMRIQNAISQAKAGNWDVINDPILGTTNYYNIIISYRYFIKEAQRVYRQCRENYRTSLQNCLNTACTTANSELKPILAMQKRNMIGYPIEAIQLNDNKVIGANYTNYLDLNSGTNCSNLEVLPTASVLNIYPYEVYQLELGAPVVEGTGTNDFKKVALGTNSITKDSRYFTARNRFTFNALGKLITQLKVGDIPSSYIWGYNNAYPIAQVVNANSNQLFHTSFEEATTGVTNGGAKTGGKYWNTATYTIPTNQRPSNTAGLVMSYWWRDASGVWQFQPPVTYNATITKSGATGLDEIRVYPSGAMMTTYTYTHLWGMTSQMDVNGVTVYYEYDALGRLQFIKDDKGINATSGNIIKQFDYNYKQ
jgi:hypothetical protein